MYGIDDYLIFGATVGHPPQDGPMAQANMIEGSSLGRGSCHHCGLKHGLGRTLSLLETDDLSTASKVCKYPCMK